MNAGGMPSLCLSSDFDTFAHDVDTDIDIAGASIDRQPENPHCRTLAAEVAVANRLRIAVGALLCGTLEAHAFGSGLQISSRECNVRTKNAFAGSFWPSISVWATKGMQ